MVAIIDAVKRLHDAVFGGIEQALGGWFLGLFARFAFAAVLFGYLINSARTKVGEGVFGFLSVSDSAYYQIALPAVEAAGGDVSKVAYIPWGLIVYAGTYAEFILPVLIVAGLFTRVAALGMIVFVIVQSYVDITVHQVDATTVGAWFDRFSDSLVMDQRLMWSVALVYLVVRGAGLMSLDALIESRWRPASSTAAA